MNYLKVSLAVRGTRKPKPLKTRNCGFTILAFMGLQRNGVAMLATHNITANALLCIGCKYRCRRLTADGGLAVNC